MIQFFQTRLPRKLAPPTGRETPDHWSKRDTLQILGRKCDPELEIKTSSEIRCSAVTIQLLIPPHANGYYLANQRPRSARNDRRRTKICTNLKTKQTQRSIKIVTWNADGIRTKIPEFEEYIQRYDPDIIALQETFLQPCHSFNIPNYTIYRNDRLTHRGGGTAILIKNSIAHHSIHIHTHALENTTIVLEGTNKITISCIYRPPNSPHQTLIPDLLKILRNRTHCFIAGDFNAKHHSWSPQSRNNTCGSTLFKFIRNCGFLLSSSSEPTTVPNRANARPATIDLGISCGLDDVLVETQVELSSDHNPVQFILPANSNKPHAQNCTTFTNWNLFQDLLTTSIPGNPTINSTEGNR
ncbi:probable RNA-directed DNA polymerase from transposon X-element [Trichonephila clavipes]|nr:probable RNA-directed DNA polymerase from transposon X-element [Trichonephila clavipes]